jgi:hypothetical protein
MQQRLRVPQPLEMPWSFKPLSSARTSLARLPNGQLELAIRHDILRGVSPEMLSWWFRRIDDTMDYLGRRVPRYRVWHPRDHIFYQDVTRDTEGLGGSGTRRHIVEAFQEDPRYLVNIIDRVAHLDETGILLVTERAGLTLGRWKTPPLPLLGELATLQHDFSRVPTGTRYESRMLVGADSLVGRLGLNRQVLPRVAVSEAMGMAWLRHNVEEVGNFERFLPALYERWQEGGDNAALMVSISTQQQGEVRL